MSGIEDLKFFNKIKYLEKTFNSPVFVLFHDDLKKDSWQVFDRIAKFVGANYERSDINLNSKHKSYSEKSLLVIRKVSRRLFRQNNPYSKVYAIRKVQRWLRMVWRYLVLFSANFIPEKWIGSESLIPQAELDKVREYFEDDWQACLDYAKQNNPV